MAIKLEVLSCPAGDIKIDTDDNNPEDRKKLSKEIVKLLKKGFLVTLGKGKLVKRITGYDADANEWILDDGKNRTKAPAKDTTATVIAPLAGG